ncbi:MAG TPA: gephyrin-like molybdotransferase Glp [Polyangiales bacterium]
MKSVEEAYAEVLAAFAPLGSERVPLLSSLGRFSARRVVADKELPPFDNSAMDGYAFAARDLAETSAAAPLVLPVRGESRAGGERLDPLVPGSAQRIFTGAPLPPGADTVELQENVARDGDKVRFERAPRPGANVRARGSDVALGAPALEAHCLIGPGEIALLASLEQASVDVFRRPRVAIVCTGDELRDLGAPARPGSIVNSNAYALVAQVREAGADAWLLPPARDRRDEIVEALRAALSADVVVLSGGVSVGEYDLVRDALADVGVELAFYKVRMKPGKPLSFGRNGRVPVLGLPGNPVSAWVTFELFVRPGLRLMLGDPSPSRARLQVRLTRALAHAPGRTEFARAQLRATPAGVLAAPLANQGSGALSSLVGVDALLEIPADRGDLPAGTELRAWLVRALPDAP